MKEKRALTTGEVAKYCGVHFRTVTRWIQKGHLKAFRLPGRGDSRIFVQDFIEFLKAHHIDLPADLNEPTHQIKALIVEDDAPMARSIKRTLEGMGILCEVASNGFRAGALIASYRPNLITLDLGMPGIGGSDVLEILRSQQTASDVGVLLISGQEEPAIKKAMASGANGSLKKPFTKSQLETKVREILDKIKPARL